MYCRNCGSKLAANAKFCTECGAKVNLDQGECQQAEDYVIDDARDEYDNTDYSDDSGYADGADSEDYTGGFSSGSGNYDSGSNGGNESEFLPASYFRHQASESMQGYFGLSLGSLMLTCIIGGVFPIVLMGPMACGLCSVYLKISDREDDARIGTLFHTFDVCFGSALWLFIRQAIFTFLWSLLLVIPGIVKAYAYSMSFFIKADHPEITAKEAMEASMRLMNGYKWRLFCLQLSFIGWYILCGLTFGILYIWVGPRLVMSITEFYKWYIRDRY